jgi:Spy/CpxP family protein refolding chaperone
MSRARTLLVVILPSMVLGGFLFSSQAGHAESGRDGGPGFWPASSDTATGVVVAQADPWAGKPRGRPPAPPPAPPAPPVPAVPPVPPVPPVPHKHGGHRGMSISIHDGKVEIDGIQEMVQEQLEAVTHVLDSLNGVPPEARDKVKARVRALKEKLKGLERLKTMDIDKLGPEVERMGDEIEKAMEGLDKDLEQLGDKLGKNLSDKINRDFAKRAQPGRTPVVVDHSDGNDDDGDDDSGDDDDNDMGLPPTAEDALDPSDLRDRVAALRALPLDPSQKAKLAKLRADSEAEIRTAQAEREEMSSKLHARLGDAMASEGEISSLIDRISAKEAAIRKARILTWVKARKLFSPEQQKKIEAALRKNH